MTPESDNTGLAVSTPNAFPHASRMFSLARIFTTQSPVEWMIRIGTGRFFWPISASIASTTSSMDLNTPTDLQLPDTEAEVSL